MGHDLDEKMGCAVFLLLIIALAAVTSCSYLSDIAHRVH
jgi:hypothetical protein